MTSQTKHKSPHDESLTTSIPPNFKYTYPPLESNEHESADRTHTEHKTPSSSLTGLSCGTVSSSHTNYFLLFSVDIPDRELITWFPLL